MDVEAFRATVDQKFPADDGTMIIVHVGCWGVRDSMGNWTEWPDAKFRDTCQPADAEAFEALEPKPSDESVS